MVSTVEAGRGVTREVAQGGTGPKGFVFILSLPFVFMFLKLYFWEKQN